MELVPTLKPVVIPPEEFDSIRAQLHQMWYSCQNIRKEIESVLAALEKQRSKAYRGVSD